MKLLNTKLVLSALGIVVMLASPAFAQKPRHVSYMSQSAASPPIPGYDKNGAVVAIRNPDQHW
jgi:hypothetical protein